MDCQHLASVRVDPERVASILRSGIKCSGCDAEESIWICATCGVLNCGRYLKKHGLMHYDKLYTRKDPSLHAVCMDAIEMSVYCYVCDDYVVSDTADGRLDKLRSIIGREKKRSETMLASGGEDQNSGITGSASGKNQRKLRPRTRRRTVSTSNLSNGVENRGPPDNKKARRESTNSNSTTINSKRSSASRNLVGLRNLGNTCFMSAVLQSLGNIHEFCRVLKELPTLDQRSGKSTSPSTPNSVSSVSSTGGNSRESRSKIVPPADGPIMTEELRKVLVALSQPKSKGAISPEALFLVIWKVVPRFRGYQQQDAHEFLRYMLDRLHTELLCLLPGDVNFLQQQILSPYSRRHSSGSTKAASQSLVTSIFGGTLQSEVTCLSCKMSSKKHDPFLDLSIDIPSSARKGSTDGTRQPCELYDCLQKFVDIEELAESERFFCNSCKCKQRSTKKFWIRRLPNVLCLHLKRFRWNSYSRTKLDTHVAFPLKGMDMSNYLLSNLHETRCSNSSSCLYDLAAVIVHHGSGAGSGHYTAFVTKYNNWYHFNDSNVVATDPETVKSCKAYILFYIQREFRLPSMS